MASDPPAPKRDELVYIAVEENDDCELLQLCVEFSDIDETRLHPVGRIFARALDSIGSYSKGRLYVLLFPRHLNKSGFFHFPGGNEWVTEVPIDHEQSALPPTSNFGNYAVRPGGLFFDNVEAATVFRDEVKLAKKR